MLIELLRAAAAAEPSRPVIVGPDRAVTYGDCLARAEAMAGGIERRGLARFGVQLADVADLVAVLAASSAVGAEACTYGATLDAGAVAELAVRLDHDVVVGDRSIPGTTTLTVADLADLAEPGELPAAADAAPAMILTTGTTGLPKGARHDWRRLISGVQAQRPGSPDARWLLAYNLHQFAGIQLLLRVLADGATLVVPRSNQPADAIDAMRTHQVTHASATPTFWRFVTARLGEGGASELPLRQITLGGEAVPEHVLTDLARLFPDARISQVYASTEFGSSVSVRDGRHGLPLKVLDRGDDAPVQFRIVDGQLEARSRIGMLGYYGEDAGVGGDEWRPTGDLVEIEAIASCSSAGRPRSSTSAG